MNCNMKLETSLTCRPTNKINARREQRYCIVQTPECCLTNCSAECVQLVLRNFEKFWLLWMCKDEF